MIVEHGGRTIILPNTQEPYRVEIETYFDHYFDAVDEDVTELDFTEPRLTRLRDFPFPVWLPSITEPVSDLQHYLDHAQLEKGDTAVDAGGYVGITAMLLARKAGPAGTVLTIEADPINADCLARNLETFRSAYGYKPILINAAIWHTAGTVTFASESAMGSAVADYISGRGTHVNVRAITLSMIRDITPRIDYLKLDIEGAETDALRDVDFFTMNRPRISIEVHRDNVSEIESLLNRYGYATEQRIQNSSLYPMIEATPVDPGVHPTVV